MDKASDFGSEDCRFESCHGRSSGTPFGRRLIIVLYEVQFWPCAKSGSGGIRTHASEETGALNQRLRPLGHATNLTHRAGHVPTYSSTVAGTPVGRVAKT